MFAEIFQEMMYELSSDPFGRTVMIVYGVFLLIMLAYSVVAYVLQSLGLHGIAKRRGIHNPWLAWIPIGNIWIIGSISDQYQYLVKGKNRNRRKLLLGLYIALYAVLIVFYVVYFAWMGRMIMGIESDSMDPGMILSVLAILAISLVMFAISVVSVVFMYIAYYDLFMSCSPEYAVLFLVLSIVFTATLPFFIFALRKKDGGMPPRREAMPIPPWQPAPSPPAPAWQTHRDLSTSENNTPDE